MITRRQTWISDRVRQRATGFLLLLLFAFPGCAPQSYKPIPLSAESLPDATIEVLVEGAGGEHETAQFRDVVLRDDDRIVLVDFTATWCGPCQQLAPELQEVKNDWGSRIDIVKVDVDDHGNLAEHFGASSIPLVLFIRNGKIIHSFVGLSRSDEITAQLQSLQ